MTDATATTTVACVVCGATLVPHTHESITVLTCPSSHGLFLDSHALRAAVRDRSEDRSGSEEQAAEGAQGGIAIETIDHAEQPRACPICAGEMTKQVYAYESGVPMDVCDEHGIWLDEGELERIEAWYEAQEHHHNSDLATWGGPTGRLEQIEERYERQRADDIRAVHWAPVGWFLGRLSWALDRRDD